MTRTPREVEADRSASDSRFQRNLPKATRLFAQKGFGQVGMRELAATMQISVGALYYYVESKEQLLQELIQEHYDTLQDILTFWTSTGGTPQPKALKGCLQQVMQVCITSPWGFMLATRDRHYLCEKLQATLEPSRQSMHDKICRLMFTRGHPPGVGRVLLDCFEALPLCLERSQLGIEEAVAIYRNLLLSVYSSGLEVQGQVLAMPSRS